MTLAQAVLQIFCWQGPLWVNFLSLKRGIIQSNIHRILWKVQIIYIMYPNCMPDTMILAQAVLQIFCWQSYFTIQNAKVGKGRKVSQIFTEFYQKLIRSSTPWAQSTVYMPNIMILAQAVIQIFCWQGSIGLQCVSRKREIIQPNIHRISRKVNQVIYTLDIILVSNIMILAQAFLQIFCWQGLLWVKCLSLKREIIQSNIHRILRKVNQVIYTLDTICVSNIIILAQAVLQILCWHGPLWVKCLSLKRGIIQSYIHRILRKVNQAIYIMYLNCMIDAIILAQAVLQIFCWQDCFTIRNAKVGKGR